MTTTTAHRITGLTNGIAYTVRVAAVNAQGTGAWSAEVTGIPATGGTRQVPNAPTGVTLTVGDRALTANWNASADDGGSVITSYKVQWKSGAESWDSTTREAVTTTTAHRITGLTNGIAYTVRVAAVNAQGTGAWSAEVTGIPATGGTRQVPSAPTGMTLTVGDRALTANWNASADDGGSVITSYKVQWKSGAESWDSTTREAVTTTTAHRITGLTNGIAYTVRVAAVNAQGTGAWSAEVTGIPATLRGGGDRAVLIAVYNTTGGPNWHDNTNWLSEEGISTWYGVVTDGAGRVTDLRLYNNGLTGLIPPELAELEFITELWLNDNDLTGGIPTELGDWRIWGTCRLTRIAVWRDLFRRRSGT